MKLSSACCFALLAMSVFAAAPLAQEKNSPARLGSKVFVWESLEVKPTPVGERRDVANNPTATLQTFECHVSTLKPAQASHPPHTHPQEEMIILRDGTLDVHLNGENTRVGPGSIFFFASNNPHAVQNRGDKPATYFVFNFATAETARRRGQAMTPPPAGAMGSAIFEWSKLEAKPSELGERRSVVDRPTTTLAGLECHVTTQQAGATPGKPHRHAEELIVLVKEGLLEISLDGQAQRATPGTIAFVASGAELGVKNLGDKPVTYYVLKLTTESTPKNLAAK